MEQIPSNNATDKRGHEPESTSNPEQPPAKRKRQDAIHTATHHEPEDVGADGGGLVSKINRTHPKPQLNNSATEELREELRQLREELKEEPKQRREELKEEPDQLHQQDAGEQLFEDEVDAGENTDDSNVDVCKDLTSAVILGLRFPNHELGFYGAHTIDFPPRRNTKFTTKRSGELEVQGEKSGEGNRPMVRQKDRSLSVTVFTDNEYLVEDEEDEEEAKEIARIIALEGKNMNVMDVDSSKEKSGTEYKCRSVIVDIDPSGDPLVKDFEVDGEEDTSTVIDEVKLSDERIENEENEFLYFKKRYMEQTSGKAVNSLDDYLKHLRDLNLPVDNFIEKQNCESNPMVRISDHNYDICRLLSDDSYTVWKGKVMRSSSMGEMWKNAVRNMNYGDLSRCALINHNVILKAMNIASVSTSLKRFFPEHERKGREKEVNEKGLSNESECDINVDLEKVNDHGMVTVDRRMDSTESNGDGEPCAGTTANGNVCQNETENGASNKKNDQSKEDSAHNITESEMANRYKKPVTTNDTTNDDEDKLSFQNAYQTLCATQTSTSNDGFDTITHALESFRGIGFFTPQVSLYLADYAAFVALEIVQLSVQNAIPNRGNYVRDEDFYVDFLAWNKTLDELRLRMRDNMDQMYDAEKHEQIRADLSNKTGENNTTRKPASEKDGTKIDGSLAGNDADVKAVQQQHEDVNMAEHILPAPAKKVAEAAHQYPKERRKDNTKTASKGAHVYQESKGIRVEDVELQSDAVDDGGTCEVAIEEYSEPSNPIQEERVQVDGSYRKKKKTATQEVTTKNKHSKNVEQNEGHPNESKSVQDGRGAKAGSNVGTTKGDNTSSISNNVMGKKPKKPKFHQQKHRNNKGRQRMLHRIRGRRFMQKRNTDENDPNNLDNGAHIGDQVRNHSGRKQLVAIKNNKIMLSRVNAKEAAFNVIKHLGKQPSLEDNIWHPPEMGGTWDTLDHSLRSTVEKFELCEKNPKSVVQVPVDSIDEVREGVRFMFQQNDNISYRVLMLKFIQDTIRQEELHLSEQEMKEKLYEGWNSLKLDKVEEKHIQVNTREREIANNNATTELWDDEKSLDADELMAHLQRIEQKDFQFTSSVVCNYRLAWIVLHALGITGDNMKPEWKEYAGLVNYSEFGDIHIHDAPDLDIDITMGFFGSLVEAVKVAVCQEAEILALCALNDEKRSWVDRTDIELVKAVRKDELSYWSNIHDREVTSYF